MKDMKSTQLSVLTLLLVAAYSDASWLWMGVASLGTTSPSSHPSCNDVWKELSPQQRRMCLSKPKVIPSVRRGAEIGIKECKQQFLHERWNCTTSKADTTVFGKVLKISSKEAAFVHAITSAGVVHAVSHSCSKGNLSECACGRRSKHPRSSWDVSGCRNNVDYAIWLSQTFVDAPENVDRRLRSIPRDRALMNLHNNEAGRQVSPYLSQPFDIR